MRKPWQNSLMKFSTSKLALFKLAEKERAINLWSDRYHEKAIARLEEIIVEKELDSQTQGWREQLAARIADRWGHSERAEVFQRQAFAHNRNLTRPKVLPPYRPLLVTSGCDVGFYNLSKILLPTCIRVHQLISSNRH